MYSRLRKEIDNIQIIDNHGHPGLAEYVKEIPLSEDAPKLVFAEDIYRTPQESARGFKYSEELHYEAYDKIYGFTKEEIDNPEKRTKLAEIYEAKRKKMSKEINQILDLSGVETLIANHGLPESYKKNPRIKHTPPLDPLIFPFNNNHYNKNQSGKAQLHVFEYILSQWKKKHNYIEQGLQNYLKFIDQVIETHITEGVVGFKFLIAYIRTTYFETVEEKDAPELYSKAMRGDLDAYHQIQDYFVWHIMRKIFSYDMPIQFHLAVLDSFVEDFDPLNLAVFLQDKELASAKIVVLHGGYPRFENAEALALAGVFPPNNVHIDVSGRITLFNHPRILARTLRNWLEKPRLWNKIVYGSDVFWGERHIYTCARLIRDAVYLALSGMIDEEIIDEDTAKMISANILRENAKRLYKL
jgi:predicted TIM-barrel fold metal-dependent hydrolase